MKNVIASSLLSADLVEELRKHSIHCIQGFKSSFIQNETAYHPDMLFYKLKSDALLTSSNIPFVNILDIFVNVIYSECSPVDGYPNDCIFNCFNSDRYLICGPNPCKEIVADALNAGLEILKVRQGYCACSTIKLSSTAFISSDAGIVKALLSTGHDALYVTNEGIELNGYGNGFIGGCALCTDDAVMFTGAIEKHKDYEKIKSFAANYGKSLISLTNRNLYDYGGFIAI